MYCSMIMIFIIKYCTQLAHTYFLQETAYKKLNSQINKKLRNSSTGKNSHEELFILIKEVLNIFLISFGSVLSHTLMTTYSVS